MEYFADERVVDVHIEAFSNEKLSSDCISLCKSLFVSICGTSEGIGINTVALSASNSMLHVYTPDILVAGVDAFDECLKIFETVLQLVFRIEMTFLPTLLFP